MGSEQTWDWDRWRSDEAIALLGPASRCVMFEILGVMWKSGETGELSGSFADLAKLCRVSLTEARAGIEEIKARNAAEISIGNGVVTIINRKMQREHQERLMDAQKRRFDAEINAWRQANFKRRKRGLPDLPRPLMGSVTVQVTGEVTEVVTGAVTTLPPPPSSPPHTPPLTPTTPEIPIAAQSGGDRVARSETGSEPGKGEEKTPRKRAERKLTEAQLTVRGEFQEWWINHGWPRAHHGVVYPDFDGADAVAVLKIMRCPEIGWDLERAKSLAEIYLREPELYGCIGHKLRTIGHRLGHYLSRLKAKEKGIQHHGGTNSNNFAGSRRPLPNVKAG